MTEETVKVTDLIGKTNVVFKHANGEVYHVDFAYNFPINDQFVIQRMYLCDGSIHDVMLSNMHSIEYLIDPIVYGEYCDYRYKMIHPDGDLITIFEIIDDNTLTKEELTAVLGRIVDKLGIREHERKTEVCENTDRICTDSE
jgi:hypothetical protein